MYSSSRYGVNRSRFSRSLCGAKLKTNGIIVSLVICIICSAPAGAAEPKVNGFLHEVNGQRILHVWGTHYEMGYAHGYLLADDIMQMFNDYILYLLPKAIYEPAHYVMPLWFALEDEYREEVQGLLDGMIDSGFGLFIPHLGRDLDLDDLIFCNALGDIGAMACSTQMAWGPATENDAQLQGEMAVVRNLDWALFGPDRFLLAEKTIVLVFTPTVNQGQTVASVSFPGFFGCLSCINEEGVTAVVNIAHNGVPLWEIDLVERFYHSGLTLREALHAGDLNQDGQTNLRDVSELFAARHRSGAIVINMAQPAAGGGEDPAVVIEADNKGLVLRTPLDEPGWYDDILLATNDLRILRPFEPCDRYDEMKKQITERGGKLTLDEMWSILSLVQQESFLSTTAQSIYFIPSTLEIGMAYSDGETMSCDKSPSRLTWEDITALPEGVDLPDDDTSVGNDDDQADHGSDDAKTGGCG